MFLPGSDQDLYESFTRGSQRKDQELIKRRARMEEIKKMKNIVESSGEMRWEDRVKARAEKIMDEYRTPEKRAEMHAALLRYAEIGRPSSRSSGPGYVYVIREERTGLYKIGITKKISRRKRELGVGKTSTLVSCEWYSDARAVERAAHQKYRHAQIPQTEYFCLSSPPTV
jgi:hypothetical protein